MSENRLDFRGEGRCRGGVQSRVSGAAFAEGGSDLGRDDCRFLRFHRHRSCEGGSPWACRVVGDLGRGRLGWRSDLDDGVQARLRREWFEEAASAPLLALDLKNLLASSLERIRITRDFLTGLASKAGEIKALLSCKLCPRFIVEEAEDSSGVRRRSVAERGRKAQWQRRVEAPLIRSEVVLEEPGSFLRSHSGNEINF